jgi:dTMP kinase
MWIAFEGPDGSGKSTQAARLAARLDAVLTREPGGTELGLRVRHLVQDADDVVVAPRTEMLLYAADRAQHVAEVVAPALAAGRHVVSDRSVWSSVVYQGIGRGIGTADVTAVNDAALGGRWPDVVVLVRATPASSRSRMQRDLDRIERAGDAFHDAVRAGFDALAAEYGWVVVDGDASVEDVSNAVWAAIEPLLGQAG